MYSVFDEAEEVVVVLALFPVDVPPEVFPVFDELPALPHAVRVPMAMSTAAAITVERTFFTIFPPPNIQLTIIE